MEKKLQPLKNKLLLFFFFVLSVGVFGQTLATYEFNNTLNATGATIGTPVLRYYNSSNVNTNPNYQNGGVFGFGDRMLYTSDENSYVELSINTTGYDGINVSWYGELSSAIFATGTWAIFVDYGSGYSSTPLLEMDLFNFIAFFSDGRTENITLDAAANNNPNLKIKIQATDINGARLRMDNLVITSRSPKINTYGYNTSNALSQIPVLADAATYYGTDFGIVNTDDTANPNASTRTFRITNNGAATLNISNITFSGDNPGDFAWVTSPATPAPSTPAAVNAINSFPATINAGASRDFTVRFNPSADGKRSALLNISSNANPSPYSFYVEGRGSTCETTDLVLKSNTMEASQTGSDVLTATLVSGNFNKVSGNSRANNGNPNDLSNGNGTRLYCQVNTNKPLFTSSNTSWYTRGPGTPSGTPNTVAFGPVDITNENGVYISFNLAAFSTATSTDFNNNDYVELQVLNPDTNDWSSELRIIGNNDTNQNENSRYSFDVGATAETFYDGDDAAQVFTNGNNVGSKYSKVKLKLPGSANFQNLAFRIVAYNTSNQKLWLIDDVAVSSANVIQRKWNGTSWRDANNNAVTGPNETTKSYKNYKAVFEGNYNVPASGLTVCECEVNNNVNLTVPANRYLAVQTKITNLGNGDNFVVNSGGNLIQIEDEAMNSGSITAERLVSDINNISTHMDYLYWSAPVSGQGLKAFSPGTPDNRIFQYNEPNDLFKAVPLATEPNFVPGKGYAFRAESGPGISNPYSKTYKFKGVPNNGLIEREVQRSPNTGAAADVVHGYNLIGNPYPSNMSFEEFYQLNKDVIYNTAWFWTNNFFTPNQQGSGYGQNNYAVWNGTGGVAATAPADSNPSNPTSNTTTPNGIVTVGQGFIVQVKNLGLGQKVQFRNRNGNTPLRVNNAGTFFSRQNEEKDRFWLKLISADSIVNSQLIGYIDGATNGYEQDYDAELMGMSSDVFYSLLEDRKLQIQGKAAFDPSDNVQLGANIFKNGTYTIAIENPEGIFNAGQKVYLKDNLLNRWVDLKAQAYTFEATKGITEGRFEIVYESPTVLATDAVTKDEVMVYRDSGDFVVKAKSKKITSLEVYDGSGRLVYTTRPNDTKVVITGDRLNRGVYILKINQDGVVTGKKILK